MRRSTSIRRGQVHRSARQLPRLIDGCAQMTFNLDALLNDFAFRCFRDMADGDYVVARQAFRLRLIQQGLWSGLQTIEKYFKCILLLNRVVARDLNHDLGKALALIRSDLKFEVGLPQKALDFIGYLDQYGRYRYYEASWAAMGREMLMLDHAVWHLRRYCQVLDYELEDGAGNKKAMLQIGLAKIEQGDRGRPEHYAWSQNGKLEKIIRDKKHPARSALLWQNMFFGSRARKGIMWPANMNAGNAPLTLHPHIVDEVRKYVYLPKDVIRAYQQLAAHQAAQKSGP